VRLPSAKKPSDVGVDESTIALKEDNALVDGFGLYHLQKTKFLMALALAQESRNFRQSSVMSLKHRRELPARVEFKIDGMWWFCASRLQSCVKRGGGCTH
jgi:hypothetical protein